MARLVAPDKRVAETEVGGKTYRPKNGIYEVSSARDARAMKAEGFFEATLSPYSAGDNARGYNCAECGFGSWFKVCGKCGHENGPTMEQEEE